MGWIEKPRQERIADVERLVAHINKHCPDRFWSSTDQDGIDTQVMRVLLPAGEDIYYNVTIETAQHRAARLVAYQLGQRTGEPLAITPDLLDGIMHLGQREVFQIDHGSLEGVGLSIVVNTDGLTHEIIDYILGNFLDNEQVPLDTNPIPADDIVYRLISIRDKKKHHIISL